MEGVSKVVIHLGLLWGLLPYYMNYWIWDCEKLTIVSIQIMSLLEVFLKKYPTVKKDSHYAIITVDPEEWWVSDDPKTNTVKCCDVQY